MTQLSIMIAMLAALALGGAPESKLFNNTDGGPLAASAQTDYNNNASPRAENHFGLNPVQHSE